jgi:endonuclease/exonuclease/phosphatase family metal-dependent hydrolase
MSMRAAPPSPTVESRGAERLRLATWNLAWLDSREGEGLLRRTNEDFARLAGYARRIDADVIAVQEVDGEEALRRVFPAPDYDLHTTTGSSRQQVGFAWRRGLLVTPLPDYVDLALGHLRGAADIRIRFAGSEVRLLSVHLKAGCRDGGLDEPDKACSKFHQQVPVLEGCFICRARRLQPPVLRGAR